MSRKLICKNDIVDSIKKYEPLQLKIFYGMLYKFKDLVKHQQYELTDEIELYLHEIKELTGKGHFSQQYIKEMINDMPREIYFNSKTQYGIQSVFSYIKYDFEYDCLIYKMDKDFAEILTEMLDKYTIIEFKDLTSLSSKYSQRLYELSRRYLKQENYLMRIEDFKQYFDIPGTYKMCNIDYKILKPAIKQLDKNTKISCKYSKRKKGKTVTHILFQFKECGENE